MFVINIPYLDLDQTYDSGQCFRWLKLKDKKYVVQNGDKAVKLEQDGERFMFGCNDEDFYKIWFHYFDLQTDYQNLNFAFKKIDDSTKVWANRAKGVRVLKQDPLETLLAYSISKDCNYGQVQYMMQSIAEYIGKEHSLLVKNAGSIVWYEFPNAFAILENQDILKKCLLNKDQLKMVVKLCMAIVSDVLNLDLLDAMQDVERIKGYLQGFGLLDVTTENIILHTKNNHDVFPKPKAIRNLIKNEYMLDCEDFIDWGLEGQNHIGVFQQYLMYNVLNPTKEVETWG